MIKNLVGLEHKVEDRIIKLICDNDCPLIHLKEALFQFSKYIGHLEDQAKLAAEKAKEEQDAEVKLDKE